MSINPPDFPRRRSCGTAEVHHRLLERQDYQERRLQIERFTSRFMLFDGHVARAGVVTIPVVVHVVHRNDDERIGAAQIQSQIDVLNRDYRKTNADVANVPNVWKNLSGDARIEFKLATADPAEGAAQGITYTQTDRASFSTDDAVKSRAAGGADPWPSDRYLNMWVCTLGGGLLGYAQFPGGPAEKDGVVILNRGVGTTGTATAPFNLGRTATHEIGHWLNLIHIWGDRLDCSGTDLVEDTPTAQRPNYGSPTFPSASCSNGPNGDMFMNFMDYVDDAAMYMFTEGQVGRMSATLDGPRSGIGRS